MKKSELITMCESYLNCDSQCEQCELYIFAIKKKVEPITIV